MTPARTAEPGAPGLADEFFRSAGFREIARTWLEAPFWLPSAARTYGAAAIG